jgi:serine protease AprX
MKNVFADDSQERVREVLGKVVASKTTDAFREAFVRPPSGLLPADTWLVVLELTPEPAATVPLREAVESMRGSPGWKDALEGTRSLLRKSLDPRSAPRVDTMLNPTALLREVYVRELRERCHRAAAPVRTRLERAAARLRERFPDLEGEPGLRTEYCWLNQTFRAWLDAEGLRDVGAHTVVHVIDVPRRMELETKITGEMVFATQYRAKTSHGGKGVVVAVIDDEVMRSHRAFEDRVHHMGNFSDQNWGDPQHHGTEVAGIIAARDGEFSGMAPDTTIYSYKVKPQLTPEDFFVACALQQALEDGTHIANCSWGLHKVPTDGKSRMALACNRAWECGMTIVKSAGNEGKGENGMGTITCPGDAQGVIVVGATNRRGSGVLGNSSQGPVLSTEKRPHLVAPGGDGSDAIVTCTLDGEFGESKEGLTSFAAAHVTGLLALLLEAEPDSTPDELRERLLGMCEKLKGDPDENVQGKGLVSLRTLVEQQSGPQGVGG